jgi:putative Mg2+ transporter-C (MgtC) family protein
MDSLSLNFDVVNLGSQLRVVIDAATAALFGSLIGWERDRAGKSVGPRTMALVGLSAAAIVSIGEVMIEGSDFGDPTRALHAVITGIGFLGAGLIFRKSDRGPQGMTTAATVFATASMGVSVGLGFPLAALGLSLIILIVLRSTHVLEITANLKSSQDE